MSELARRILHRSITTMRHDCVRCEKCHRTPVPGEFVHHLASGTTVCSLCLAQVPEAARAAAEPERIHASERQLPVAPRAA